MKCQLLSLLPWLLLVEQTVHAVAITRELHDIPLTTSPAPTESPAPSPSPSETPSVSPAPTITGKPTFPIPPLPSATPTESPAPSPSPSDTPTSAPSESPSKNPSVIPTKFVPPTLRPTNFPSRLPSESLIPSLQPSLPIPPTQFPSKSLDPTQKPTIQPRTLQPSSGPTLSIKPRDFPSKSPRRSPFPSTLPTESPTQSLVSSSLLKVVPSKSMRPTLGPSTLPSVSMQPRRQPSLSSSTQPSSPPSDVSTLVPSGAPNHFPSSRPSGGQRSLVANTTVLLKDVTGMMNNETALLFEETALLLLTDKFPKMDNFEINFLSSQVIGQVFRYHLVKGQSVGNLTVYFTIIANISPGEPVGFDFQRSIESFFKAYGDNLANELQGSDGHFQPDQVQSAGAAKSSDGSKTQKSLAGFFSTSVIIGISITIAAVVIVGAFVMSRPMWRKDEGYKMESPGRLGAVPSCDSEDQILRGIFHSDESSVVDPQSIFMSLSKNPNQQPDNFSRGMRSVGNSTATGSHLVSTIRRNANQSRQELLIQKPNLCLIQAGLDISQCHSLPSVESISRGSRGTSQVDVVKSDYCEENYNAIRSRSKSILESMESQSFSNTSSTRDHVTWDGDGESEQNLWLRTKGTNSSEESSARKRKRLLERRLFDIKERNGPSSLKTLHEVGSSFDGLQSEISMQDLIMASSQLRGNVQSDGAQVRRSQFGPYYSRASPGVKLSTGEMDTSELIALGERIAVEQTPQRTRKKMYERMSDISGTIVDMPDTKRSAALATPNSENDFSQANSKSPGMNSENDPSQANSKTPSKSLGWFRRIATPDKPALSESKQSRPDIENTRSSGSRSLPLFGRSKRQTLWEKAKEYRQLSPSKRYRRGEDGHLVPRRFPQQQSNDEESHFECSDSGEESNDEAETLLLGNSSDGGQNLGNPRAPGSTSQKHRPPKLDLKTLEASNYTDNDREVETPLSAHPVPGSTAMSLVYGQGMVYGQDPDGFALSSYHKRFGVVASPRKILSQSYSDPSQQDPPTASEHRRTIAAAQNSKKKKTRTKKRRSSSGMRQLHSPQTNSVDYVSFKDTGIEIPIDGNEDVVILGSMETSDSNLELEWGNVI